MSTERVPNSINIKLNYIDERTQLALILVLTQSRYITDTEFKSRNAKAYGGDQG